MPIGTNPPAQVAVTAINVGDSVNPTIANTPHTNLNGSVTNIITYLTNDGPGSGINADYLDNFHGSYYLDLTNAVNPLLSSNFTDTSHGTRSGGTLHTLATDSIAGFLSAADKTKLDSITVGANQYVLPAATVSTLGGVIVGAGLTVQGNGTLSVTQVQATTGALGFVQIGTGILVTSGVISLDTTNLALLNAANTFSQTQLAPAWNTPSARHLKEELRPLDLSKYDFKHLLAQSWKWTPESGYTGTGVGTVADEARRIAPEVVGTDGESVNYGMLAFLMAAKLYAERE